ncbi:hypothetical protein M413DRAFT_32127 [Hebeloma cylindrosporum]|uniref:Lysophospholipase n=1 Tax=Hebeloma cylindrosporum TaxID=76867 RepID=A0A0C3BUY6_HEBCY|nr:hypothetical protein M413DRAFT_32127 [Hebeloma cylindrosporum h7]
MIGFAKPILLSTVLLTLTGAVHAQSAATKPYTPSFGQCPSDFSLVRLAGSTTQTLSKGESDYISARNEQVLPGAWKSYLETVQGTGANLPSYISDILGGKGKEKPTLGIAQSGGGLRAAIVGAGIMNALDSRNQSSKAAGTGGLLQAATYVSALSGGSWLVTSLALANYPTIQDLIFPPTSGSSDTNVFGGWLADTNVLAPSTDQTTNAQFIGTLFGEIAGKLQAGFPVTFADVWSRALARHFVNGTTAGNVLSNATAHGAGVTFSSIANTPSFVAHQQPFPIVLVNTDSSNGNKSVIFSDVGGLVPITNPIYEFNVYEMGSWDPTLSAFTPTQYLGSRNNSICVTGFDQASLIEATSSGLFEQFNTSASALASSPIGAVFTPFNQTFFQPNVELISAQYPNPFKGVAGQSFIDTNEDLLSLVDGGHDGENIPIQPLLVKARGVDTIFVIDVSDDDKGFATGRSMIATQNRTTFYPSSYSFPPVPGNTSTYVLQNLTTRPTFFGCNGNTTAPLVIYVANGGPPQGQPILTNQSSFFFDYPEDLLQSMLQQSFTFATQGRPNSTAANAKDPEWPACLACAAADRARERSGASRSGVCVGCFERYCWEGDGAAATGTSSKAKSGYGRNGVDGVLVVVLGLLALLMLH